MMEHLPDNYRGCLIGGAIGDALGAPIEFMGLEAIQATYGEGGVRDFVEYPGHVGEFTDDTQMTLFTAEGLLRAYNRGVQRGLGGGLITIAHRSYLRWLHTQGVSVDTRNLQDGGLDIENGWLIRQNELHKRRAPGNTCLKALSSGIAGTMDHPINESKGCGTIMRVAPVGLFYHQDNTQAFQVACELSALTHSHPTGYLSAGFLASVLSDLTKGAGLEASIGNAMEILKGWPDHSETVTAVMRSRELFEETKADNKRGFEVTEKLGGGWIAEEALSIALYCALAFENDFKNGVLYAVNHSGDSDSTGSITGNILGLINGESSIPATWIENLRYRDVVVEVAEDLHTVIQGDTHGVDDEWWEKYPGH